ncbi:tellurium resistance protein [Aliiroseovarius sp. KMU-50]|uniref:Tellurium resistance protein n=1 Tax=Aliiroseovarius salicola TaxID=3009082 RepID=A0ABT4W5G0_9RHOB|nr:tellurium resistance protein [Aliiroseovarius sp. KMU-50]MDA5095721.1 tellurium resistance protein [Aliiroseovarius sp. KMU-50]
MLDNQSRKAPYFPPPKPIAPKSGLFQRTPPAVFPPIFGLMGLGLAWRRAGESFALPQDIGELMLGAVSLLFLFSVAAYLIKLMRRPAVFVEDLRVLPGRAGLAAMGLTGYLLAAVLIIYSPTWAIVTLCLSGMWHLAVVIAVIRILIASAPEARVVTPVWHLTFVGFIIGPIAALPLGFHLYSYVIFWITLVIAVGIYAASALAFAKKSVPAPLRPLLAIHLAPTSLLGTVAYLMGDVQMGIAFAYISVLIFAILVLSALWLTKDGFSPLWGAFTFPLVAFSTLMQIAYLAGEGSMFRILGGGSLIIATLIIPPIAVKIFKLWAKGVLAVKTNAAQA